MKLVEVLTIFLICLTPLGQLARINLGQNIFFYPNDVIIPLILIVWLIYRLVVTKKIKLPRLSVLMLVILLWAGVGLLHAYSFRTPTEVLVSSLYLVRLVFYASLSFVIYDLVKEHRSKKLLIVMALTTLVVAIFGFIQLVVVPDFSVKAATEGWDPHQFRLLSTFYDPNFVGGFLSIGLALALAGMLKFPDRRILFGFVSVVSLVAIVLTFSRSSYLAAGTVLAVIAALRWRMLLLIIPLVAIATIIIVPRSLDRLTESIAPGTSGYARVVSWQHALNISQDNLIFGVGYNTYRYVQQDYNYIESQIAIGGNSGAGADSSLLLILATMGVPGLILWLSLLGGAGVIGWRAFRKGSPWGLALLATIPALLVHSIFLNSFFYQWVMLYFWVILGAADAEDV